MKTAQNRADNGIYTAPSPTAGLGVPGVFSYGKTRQIILELFSRTSYQVEVRVWSKSDSRKWVKPCLNPSFTETRVNLLWPCGKMASNLKMESERPIVTVLFATFEYLKAEGWLLLNCLIGRTFRSGHSTLHRFTTRGTPANSLHAQTTHILCKEFGYHE